MSHILRAASICTSAALLQPPPTFAGDLESTVLSAEIPAEPLARALEAFARQTGLQLVYVSDVVRDQRSHAVPAGLAAPEALPRMLQGTGLQFGLLTPRSIQILAAAAVPPPTALTNISAGDELKDVVVTADRREEKLQDVPITLQVLSGEQLGELNLYTFNDVIKYTPNVTYSGNGPGTGNIFIRGLGSPGTGNQSQSTVAPFPNVALYLDEQSMQFPARNNDVYMIDLERIEVLEGPQGTLFGGGAQAGAIRYITNKPRVDAAHADVNAGYGITTGGGTNHSANATLNLPLIADKFAVRAVGFVDHQGGYISNVPGTISFDVPSTIDGVRLVSPIANNADLVGSNFNPITYQGFRVSGLYRFNDDWDLLIQQSYQQMHADGSFYAYPADPNGHALRPNQITAFVPAYNKDRYESTAWTLNGRFGNLKAVYAGSFMRRHIDEQQDYSNYFLGGTYSTYYDCIGTGAAYFNEVNFSRLKGKPLRCFAPVAAWHDIVKNDHQSHEVRLSTDEKSRVRALAGAYWEKFVINDDMNFNYLGIPQCSPANLAIALAGGADCLSAVGPLPGTLASNPGLRENVNNAFGEDVQRGYKQYAVFASVDFDIIPKVLTATAGTRRYHYDEFEAGSEWFILTNRSLILDHPNGACTGASAGQLDGPCGFPIDLAKNESGFRSRANLAWHFTPDIMSYYTFSEGFRPGGFNRTASLPGQAPLARGITPYCGPHPEDPRCKPGGDLYNGNSSQQLKPTGYNSDNLTNHELGLKSEFLNHRVRVNGSAYLMHWKNVQSLALGLSGGSVGVTPYLNGPSYTVKGLELQTAVRVTEGLALEATGAWNSSRQTSVPCLKSAGVTPHTPLNPTPAGQCITVVGGRPFALGVLNSAAPFSSPLVFNLRAHYGWHGGDYHPFAWVGVSHRAASSNEPANYPDGNAPPPVETGLLKYTIPANTIYDAALGVSKDRWMAQLAGSNLSNSNAATNISSAQFIKATIPLRPRVLTLNLSYTF